MFKQFTTGVCYYPEHWPVERHADDIRRIRSAGFDYVRLGEGAWAYFEPSEGKFQFELFDRVLDLCRKHELKVVFGTPTYAGPAWIAAKYPTVLRWDFNRIPMTHGSRRNFNYTSPDYLQLSDRICTALAEHYANEPAIFAWQLDNEFNCHMDVSYAPSDTAAFREWLRKKYRTLDALNAAWGTAFWSQTYSDWEQIDLPHPSATYLNPTQLLDESRFISDCVVAFAHRQAKILRSFNKNWQITHNGIFGNIDPPKLAAELDFYSHDQYPLFAGSGLKMTRPLIEARSLSFPYAILEQQSGPGGQMNYLHRTPRPGEIRLWALQSAAHGAAILSFFLWRTCPFGSEQHWHGLVDYDNRDTRRLLEARQFIGEVHRLPADFLNAEPVRGIALLRDFDNETNARRINTYARGGDGEQQHWIDACQSHHWPLNMVWAKDSLEGYQVLLMPHQRIVTPALVEKLTEFVNSGGVLLMGCQSGIKDENVHMTPLPAPGLLGKLAGIEVEEFSTQSESERRTAKTPAGITFSFGVYVERLRMLTAKPIAWWTSGDPLLDESPAITCNQVGKGRVYYFGGYCDAPSAGQMLELVAKDAGTEPVVQAESTVEAIARRGKKQAYLCLLNHGNSPARINDVRGTDLLSGRELAEDFLLNPRDVVFVQVTKKRDVG